MIRLTADNSDMWVQSLNIGLGGMLISGRVPLSEGDEFSFSLNLEELDMVVSGIARVLWTRDADRNGAYPPGIGVTFIEFEQRGRFMLDQYLSICHALGVIEKIENRHTRIRSKNLKPA